MGKKITPRNVDYSKWYNDIVSEAGLAESSDVRGCMVIKPYGFAIWELMKSQLDNMFKETGHENAYFPLFVPKSLFEAEEKNAEGFAKECAVVTHYRLKNDEKTVGIWPRECARTIENISRIRMDVARASGTDLASSLKQNKFWMCGCVSVSVLSLIHI